MRVVEEALQGVEAWIAGPVTQIGWYACVAMRRHVRAWDVGCSEFGVCGREEARQEQAELRHQLVILQKQVCYSNHPSPFPP